MNVVFSDIRQLATGFSPEARLFCIWIIFVILNVTAFTMFGIDKQRSRNGQWRIREDTLLSMAFLGGWLGAYAGRSYFRHKTRKQPFGAKLVAVSVANVGIVGGLTIFTLVS
ncbi:DUF1294 domain-containing protein [Sphingomonas paeninsulae]|uniref:DUF1294 domain-containing protein n=1 Tax=Sphingomonas paeninsulae TaxID=2319844 RepID=A0A494TJS3_SPHPE|nr:DUF1294 domain-containing protein [Sphingomonas paeninsulae]AYJ87764.1 DUF1294 domain-containing protein [Sphingomonas paeninsulae]